MSMPPALPEVEENIVIAKLDNFEDVLYRRFLAMSYGRRKQMVSGIHFNFEFDDEMVRKMFELQDEYKNYHQFKSEVYLKVTRNYLHYRWFATYFFAASPLSYLITLMDMNDQKNRYEVFVIVNTAIKTMMT